MIVDIIHVNHSKHTIRKLTKNGVDGQEELLNFILETQKNKNFFCVLGYNTNSIVSGNDDITYICTVHEEIFKSVGEIKDLIKFFPYCDFNHGSNFKINEIEYLNSIIILTPRQ